MLQLISLGLDIEVQPHHQQRVQHSVSLTKVSRCDAIL